MRIMILSFSALLWSASVYQASAQNFSEEDLAATIALDSGYPVQGYEAYARSLAQTLNALSPAQSEKVLQGKKPLKATEAAAAKAAREAALEATPIPVEANGNGNGNGKVNGKVNGKGNGYGLLKKMFRI
jgi:hypothetical protein